MFVRALIVIVLLAGALPSARARGGEQAEHQLARVSGRRLRRPRLQIRQRRELARGEAALPHDRHGEKNAAGEVVNGSAAVAGQHRHRRQLVSADAGRRIVQAGPAARPGEILHHHARRTGPRRLIETIRWSQGPVPTLPLSRHGRPDAPAGHGRAEGRPFAADHRQLAGLHAAISVGRMVSRFDGRHSRAVVPAGRDQRPQLHAAPWRRRVDPSRSRLEQRQLRQELRRCTNTQQPATT